MGTTEGRAEKACAERHHLMKGLHIKREAIEMVKLNTKDSYLPLRNSLTVQSHAHVHQQNAEQEIRFLLNDHNFLIISADKAMMEYSPSD